MKMKEYYVCLGGSWYYFNPALFRGATLTTGSMILVSPWL